MDYFELSKNVEVAIKFERKHKYVNYIGKKSTFAKFCQNFLYQIRKKATTAEKIKLQNVILHFEQYEIDSPSARMRSIEKLEDVIKYYKKQFKRAQNDERTAQKHAFTDELADLDVMYVKGVGPKVSEIFKKAGISSVKDLIEYYPKRYMDYEGKTKIKFLKEGDDVCIFATIKKVNTYKTKKGLTVFNVTIADKTGSMKLIYFYNVKNRRMQEIYSAKFPINASIIAYGKVKFDEYSGALTLDKPAIEVITCDFEDEYDSMIEENKIVPIYQLTENLTPKMLSRAIFNALNMYGDKIKDFIPDDILKKENLMDKKSATVKIHLPKNVDEADRARYRLVFEEFFIMQLNLAILREKNRKSQKSVNLGVKRGGLVEKFIKNLPFELTNAQKNAVDEILHDLNSNEPMQRLLQGDVGSGKTVVACICLLCAIENGYQGAIMAPTEILASQHYKNFIQWLTPLNLSVGLFLGKHNVATRRDMRASLKNGQMNIAIGTHALIQEGVEFKNLGAVVIDEQHRFGVKQRAKLNQKGEFAQMLTMTATPIPRTLALSVHGDLDCTIIDEMPKGRLPIKTQVLSGRARKFAYDLIKDEIKAGHQAYIVYPLIDESETISAKNATKEYEKLKEGIFKDYKLGLLHGKLDNKTKDEVMLDFKNKKYDILISTTVVEVGVDVENATVMIIENAERFGLSQLHQLRGRIGRSNIQSHCFLISSSSSETVQKKLNIMAQTNNGFIIAQQDLELRGPGEFLGVRQSGIEDLGLADLVQDVAILEKARNYAFDFVKNNDIKKFPKLYKEVNKKDFFNPLQAG